MDEIRRRITLHAPIDEVWDAVATADGLRAWLGCSEVHVEAQVGCPVAVRWPDGAVSRGLVEAVEPPQRFAFRWRRISGAGLRLRAGEPTRVVVELVSVEAGSTDVTITESAGVLSAASRGAGPGELR